MATKKRGRLASAKKPYRFKVKVSPKFVQITAASRLRSDGEGGIDRVYALDEAGGVWEWVESRDMWVQYAPYQEPHAEGY